MTASVWRAWGGGSGGEQEGVDGWLVWMDVVILVGFFLNFCEGGSSGACTGEMGNEGVGLKVRSLLQG